MENETMIIFTKPLRAKLLKNGTISAEAIVHDNGNTPDHKPVMKLFTPWGAATWLLTEFEVELNANSLKAKPTRRAFGLCDLGMGCPELGYVDLDEILNLTGPFGLKVERDRWFKANKPLTEYADEARNLGRIIA